MTLCAVLAHIPVGVGAGGVLEALYASTHGVKCISACICPTAMNLLLFCSVFRSGKSFQLSPFATFTRDLETRRRP